MSVARGANMVQVTNTAGQPCGNVQLRNLRLLLVLHNSLSAQDSYDSKADQVHFRQV